MATSPYIHKVISHIYLDEVDGTYYALRRETRKSSERPVLISTEMMSDNCLYLDMEYWQEVDEGKHDQSFIKLVRTVLGD